MVIVVACCHSLSLEYSANRPIDQRPSHGRRRRRRPRAGSESDPRSAYQVREEQCRRWRRRGTQPDWRVSAGWPPESARGISPCRPVASEVSSQRRNARPFTPHSPPSLSQPTTSRGGGGLCFEDRSPSQGTYGAGKDPFPSIPFPFSTIFLPSVCGFSSICVSLVSNCTIFI